MILHAQLFGVEFNSKLDTLEGLKKLKEMGYQYVEPCVSLMTIPGLEKAIWPVETFRELMPKIREIGLDVESVHIFAQSLIAGAEELKTLAQEFGLKYYVVKTPQDMSDISLQQASIEYMTFADAVAEAGVKVLLHNESADIEAKSHGKTVYEYFLDLCQGKVLAQVDIGWVWYGGEDIMALLKRNQTRVAAIHYKDFDADKKPVTIGQGVIDLKESVQFARAYGLPNIVDQDAFVGDVFETMAQIPAALSRFGQYRSGVSYLNVIDTETGEITTLQKYDKIIEAPNWMRTTNELVFNSEGLLYAYNVETGEERQIETGECDNCNNDHVLAPDETGVAVSHGPRGMAWGSYVYTIPFETGVATKITPDSPSFLHGWSPDGKALCYCGFRMVEGKLEVDIYEIPADGSGPEVRLTNGGFNDGSEYDPEGAYIWYHSTNSGIMQVWRMKRDGSEQTQMTFNDRNNWFPHISPDSQKVVYIAYHVGHLSPNEHLPNMQVELWLMDIDGSNQHRLISFFGGQGSINVNSWAPDSKRLAFVSYEM